MGNAGFISSTVGRGCWGERVQGLGLSGSEFSALWLSLHLDAKLNLNTLKGFRVADAPVAHTWNSCPLSSVSQLRPFVKAGADPEADEESDAEIARGG